MNSVEKLIKEAVAEAARLSERSVGELCMEICSRLAPNEQIRITTKGIRVTHTSYIDKLSCAEDVDKALRVNLMLT